MSPIIGHLDSEEVGHCARCIFLKTFHISPLQISTLERLNGIS